MPKVASDRLSEKIDTAIQLLRYLVALELSRSGASRAAIGKHIHVAKAEVVKMLKDVNRD